MLTNQLKIFSDKHNSRADLPSVASHLPLLQTWSVGLTQAAEMGTTHTLNKSNDYLIFLHNIYDLCLWECGRCVCV